jgi:hypothetical protein
MTGATRGGAVQEATNPLPQVKNVIADISERQRSFYG